jgi:hypothetical protein
MGKLIYDADVAVTFDDRVLAHLQQVIGAKLRRGEPFFFTWKNDPRAGDGRTSIWLHPARPLRFKFSGSMPVDLNRAWLEELIKSADSKQGLVLVPEPRPGR